VIPLSWISRSESIWAIPPGPVANHMPLQSFISMMIWSPLLPEQERHAEFQPRSELWCCRASPRCAASIVAPDYASEVLTDPLRLSSSSSSENYFTIIKKSVQDFFLRLGEGSRGLISLPLQAVNILVNDRFVPLSRVFRRAEKIGRARNRDRGWHPRL
jgi:hypothetical protein